MTKFNFNKMMRVLKFIIKFKKDNDGISPTVREIRDALGYLSTSTIAHYIDCLKTHGYIEVDWQKSRFIKVVGGQWIPPEENYQKEKKS